MELGYLFLRVCVQIRSCHRGRRAGAASTDAGLIDLALARVQIRSIIAGAEVGDPDLACTIVEARVCKCIREGVAREWRGSRAAMPMAPRVWSRVAKGVAREWSGKPWD